MLGRKKNYQEEEVLLLCYFQILTCLGTEKQMIVVVLKIWLE